MRADPKENVHAPPCCDIPPYTKRRALRKRTHTHTQTHAHTHTRTHTHTHTHVRACGRVTARGARPSVASARAAPRGGRGERASVGVNGGVIASGRCLCAPRAKDADLPVPRRDAAHYTFSSYGTCSRINGRYFCSQWCDDTFPVDSTGATACDAAVARAHARYG